MFSCLLLSASGQKTINTPPVTTLTKLDLGPQGVGISYEPKILHQVSVDLCAGAGGGYNIAEGSIDYELLEPAFYFSVTPKYFYNLQKRKQMGKSTLYNSGNYIGVRLKYSRPFERTDDLIRNSVLVNIHWGIQRAIGKNWLFNSHVGAGYAQDVDYNFGTVYPSLDFAFAYILQKPKM